METADVIVAGGGIIGLSVALELALSGQRVMVLERGRTMNEASWAAAGMLAAEDPENPSGIAELAALSRSLYPKFLSTVERLSGRSVRLRTQNTLMVGDHFDCVETATRKVIPAEEATAHLPGVVTGGRSFLWMEEASLDPRDLCAALPLAAKGAGVTILEGTAILSMGSDGRLVEVKTATTTYRAAAVVNCCGAWSGQIQPVAAAVGPWKGQMHTVRLAAPVELPFVVRTPKIYLVPRGGGLVVVGATVERVGYDRQVEAGAEAWLGELAAEVWPPIASGAVVERWTGLRPGTEDGLPLIGSAGVPGCWVATGHFRNGILLAPATAVVVRESMEGRVPSVALERFTPGRSS